MTAASSLSEREVHSAVDPRPLSGHSPVVPAFNGSGSVPLGDLFDYINLLRYARSVISLSVGMPGERIVDVMRRDIVERREYKSRRRG